MPRSPRRYLLASSIVLAVGSVTAGAIAVAAAPAAGAAPASQHVAASPNLLGLPSSTPTLPISLPTLPTSLPTSLPTCVPLLTCPTATATSTATASASSSSCPLPAPFTALCALFPGGGTLPTGSSTANPSTFPNNANAQKVVITDPFEQLYNGSGGANVQLIGPDGGSTVINPTGDPVFDDTAGTITVTFDLTKPTPAVPGGYELTISPADPTGLSGALGTLGLPTTLPLDQVAVTITKGTGPGPVTALTATPISGTTASLKWTAPTTTDPAVTGYAIIVSKTATATATDSGITVTQTGTATTASVAGLTAGTKYFVSVAAKSDSGNGPVATANFTTPYVSSLTLVTNPSSAIVGGGKLEMSGELDHMVNGAKTPLSGKTVGLLVKYAHATHSTKITTVTTNASGKYDFTFTPTGGGQFVAAFLGDAATATTPGDSYAVSNIVPVTDTPAVTLSGSSKKSGKKHEFLKLKGSVSPSEQGKKVFIFSTGGGADQKIGKAHVASNGKYALKKRVKKGNYTLEARIKSHGALLAASSNSITL